MLQPRTRPLMLLAPLLGVTIFFAAQSGLQAVRPDGLDVRIRPRTTADYGPWPIDHVQPVDPALSTVVAEDDYPTPIIVNTPNPNVEPAAVNMPTTGPNAAPRVMATRTLALAATMQRPSNTPTRVSSPTSMPTATRQPSSTPAPTNTLLPSRTPTPDPTSITATPSKSSGAVRTRRPRVQPTRKPKEKNDPPGKGNGK